MSRLRFLSRTSVALAAAAAAAVAGCGDDSCGPGGAPEVGLIASSDAATILTYGQLRAGPNNDCPAAGAPAGVISLTITGTQADATGGFVTLCVARPDLLAKQPQALALDVPGAEVRIVDLGGTANTCSFAIDPAQPADGTATTTGLCGNGSDPAGFALVIDGSLSLSRTCGSMVDSIRVTLRGRVSVAAN
jgi:hypothetical protein